MEPNSADNREGLSTEEQDELARLETVFEHAGGRGVDLAERIDYLRRKSVSIKRVYLVAFEVKAEDEAALPDPVGFINGIRDGLPDEWFENIGDGYWIERIVTDGAWPLPDLSRDGA